MEVAPGSPETGVQELSPPETLQKYPDLIYDIGFHRGEDTDFYLRKGFRVVALEADPDLCALGRKRFQHEIESEQLILIEGAIQPEEALKNGTACFYKNDGKSDWGTARIDWANRNLNLGAKSETIEVPVIDFSEIVRKFGIPHYMKIDIEGCDMVCVRALKKFQPRPDFISIESDKTALEKIRLEIDALIQLGYDSFKAIEQSAIPVMQSPPIPAKEGRDAPYIFSEYSSGLFGRELPGPWLSNRQIIDRYRLIHLGYSLLGDDGIMKRWGIPGAARLGRYATRILGPFTKAAIPGWYDTHARHSSIADR